VPGLLFFGVIDKKDCLLSDLIVFQQYSILELKIIKMKVLKDNHSWFTDIC